MNILILNWRDIHHPLAGGAELSLHEHAKYWLKQGATITWFSSSFSKAKNEEKVDGINVIRKGSHYTVHLHAMHLYRQKKLGLPDIVIDSFHFLPFFTPLYMRKLKKVALINETAREAWFKNIIIPVSLIGFLIEPLFFLFYRKTPFITASDSAKNDVSKMGIPKELITIIPHGFTLLQQKKTFKREERPTILFLSRLTPDKGIMDAVKAVAQVYKNVPNLQFWIAGKPEKDAYLSEIEQLVKLEGISKNTQFFGFVSEEKKTELYSKAWVIVHPSTREGWGLNIIEANSVGLPAVGYNVSGLKDSIKQGETGLLSDKSIQSLAKNLLRLLQDDTLRLTMSKNAKAWASTFSWEDSGRKSWKLLRELYE